MEYVLFFKEADESDLLKIGVKGLSLAMLTKQGYKVPPGFIITTKLFDQMLFTREIRFAVDELFKASDREMLERSETVQRLIRNYRFPEDAMDEISESYYSLNVDTSRMSVHHLLQDEEVYVSVRSSFIEEKPDVMSSGHGAILNIKGNEKLFKALLEYYASIFTPENINIRKDNSLGLSSAIVIQTMIDSEKSGTAFSADPETGEDVAVVRACFGLGEGMGSVSPDLYTVKKDVITGVKVAQKQYEYVRDMDTDETARQDLGDKSSRQVLSDNDVIELARTARRIARSFGRQQKIEWAIRKDIIYILQSKELPFQMAEPQLEEEEPQQAEESGKAEVIDIAQPDIEEDLIVLEEIERIEKPISALPEDKIEEVKIEKGPAIISEPNRLVELAKISTGTSVVFCHMALKDRLRERLQKYANVIPDDMTKMLDILVEYEPVENESDYRIIDKARSEFIIRGKYPTPEEVLKAMKLLSSC